MKLLKLMEQNEEIISTILGAIVVTIVGIIVVNYFNSKPEQIVTNPCQKYLDYSINDIPAKCVKYFMNGGE